MVQRFHPGGPKISAAWSKDRSRVSATHALCGAHLIRNLISVGEVQRQSAWATGMTELLLQMKDAAQQARDTGAHEVPQHVLNSFFRRYDDLVRLAFDANPAPVKGTKRNALQRESYNLAVAFSEQRESICRFACDLSVPFTNNRANHDLRMVKLHRKISGSFRSMEGAERLAAVRSYISTAQKQGRDALGVLTMLFEGQSWMPAPLQAGP
ncbi:MAG: IS66 family transposase [Acidimicrobiales bacterium]